MGEQAVVNEIVRMSIDVQVVEGDPPEEQIRFGLVECLQTVAMAIREMDIRTLLVFPVIFPMELTLTSEQLQWDFRIVAKLENAKALEEKR